MDSKNNLVRKINWQQERLKFLQARICSLLGEGCDDVTIIVNVNGEEQTSFTVDPSENNTINLEA